MGQCWKENIHASFNSVLQRVDLVVQVYITVISGHFPTAVKTTVTVLESWSAYVFRSVGNTPRQVW